MVIRCCLVQASANTAAGSGATPAGNAGGASSGSGAAAGGRKLRQDAAAAAPTQAPPIATPTNNTPSTQANAPPTKTASSVSPVSFQQSVIVWTTSLCMTSRTARSHMAVERCFAGALLSIMSMRLSQMSLLFWQFLGRCHSPRNPGACGGLGTLSDILCPNGSLHCERMSVGVEG